MNTINNKVFTYYSGDTTVIYEITFTQGFPLKYNHLGKTWAKCTQCIVRKNDFVLGIHHVTKHNKDVDNLLYAYMNSFKPISRKIYKEARLNIIKQILNYCKNYEKSNITAGTNS